MGQNLPGVISLASILKLSRVLAFMSIAIAVVGPMQKGTARAETVTVGSKKFTENVVLGEILRLLVADLGHASEHVKELGGTRILWNALKAGEIDAYPDYTGTISHEILSKENVKNIESMQIALAKHGIGMTRPLGFNNTYAMGMLETLAAKHDIKTISDLRQHPQLKFGFTNEFMEREDGWPGLREVYQLPQKDVQGLDHDLAYRGIEAGHIHLIDMFSTDADIEYYKMRTLEDDKSYFPIYQAVILYRLDLEERASRVIDQFKRLEGLIDENQMIAMNAEAKLKQVPSAQVASGFLKKALAIDQQVKTQSRLSQLVEYTAGHLKLVLLSLIPSIFVAIFLGIVAAKTKVAGQGILGIAGIIQTIPALALLVMMIPFLGIGSPPAVFALFLYGLLPIVRSTYQGLTEIPVDLRESALAMGLSPSARFWRIEFPLATRSIVSGIKVAAVINIGFATLGALIGAGGYGQPILTGIRLDDLSLILLGAIPAAALAVIAQFAFEFVERWVVPRGLRISQA